MLTRHFCCISTPLNYYVNGLINVHILKLGKSAREDPIVKSNHKERLIKIGVRTYINSQLL